MVGKDLIMATLLGGGSSSSGSGGGQVIEGSITTAESSKIAGQQTLLPQVTLKEEGAYPENFCCIVWREHDSSVTSAEGFEAAIFTYHEENGAADSTVRMYGYHKNMSKTYMPYVTNATNLSDAFKKQIFSPKGLAFNMHAVGMMAVAGATYKWIVIGEGVKAL